MQNLIRPTLVVALLPGLAFQSIQAQQGAKTPSIDALSKAVVTLSVEKKIGGSTGSGVVVDPSGIILTAAHVIRDATKISVRLSNGDELVVEGALDVDTRLDLAVLRVAGFGLPVARLGNSDSVKVGERLIAIGSPRGLEQSVTDGLLSGFRSLAGSRVMQISIPVSPGSSGGPVFSESGEVVGLVVFGLRGDGAENLNFALPINYARGKLALSSQKQLLAVAAAGELAARVSEGSASSGSPVANQAPSTARVNQHLRLDLTALNGVELWTTSEDDQKARHVTKVSYRATMASDGSTVLDRTVEDRARQRVAALRTMDLYTDRSLTRLTWGDSPSMVESYERTSLVQAIKGGRLDARIGGGLSSFSGPSVSRVDPAPIGAVSPSVIGAILAALPDSLPSQLSLDLIDPSTGRLEQVTVSFGKRETIKVRIVSPNGDCAASYGWKERSMPVIWVSYAIDVRLESYPILATKPHLKADVASRTCLHIPGLR